MNWNKEFRAGQIQHQLQFFLAGVTRYVRRPSALIVHAGAAPAEVIDQAGDATFVSGNNSCADNDCIVFTNGEILVFAEGKTRQRSHGFSLASCAQDDQIVISQES